MAGASLSLRRMSTTRAVASALLCLLVASSNHGCCANKHKSGGKSHKGAHASPIAPPSPAPPATNNPNPNNPPPPGGGYAGGNISPNPNNPGGGYAGGNTNPNPSNPGGGYAGGSNNNNGSIVDSGGWLNARATWYGAPNGAGPEDNGGACGFKNVHMPPFSAMTSCGNEPIFKDGLGCGSCYQIRCVAHPACSGVPETVIITDMNYYPVAPYHFDLSGTAFGAMAKEDHNDELRHAGIIDIQFKRVPCLYPGLTVTFHVEHGSNPYYLAVLVEYANGDGDVVQVDLMESRPDDGEPTGMWVPMHQSWGSIWRMDTRRPLHGPFSLRITNESGGTLVADQVIPADWQPDAAYSSIVQFQ